MELITVSSMPMKQVAAVVVDYRISLKAANNLEKLGIRVMKTTPCSNLPKSINGHPDMLLHHLGYADFICCPESYNYFFELLRDYKFNLIKGSTGLRVNYPYDCAYNVAVVDNFVFCNIKYTEPKILEYYSKQKLHIIHVNQGYAKCNICVINAHAIITSDKGIAGAARDWGLDVLIINSGSICLPQYKYGFFGGCCGLIDQHRLAVNGDITTHPDNHSIKSFCKKHDVDILSLSDEALTDIGSILPIIC